MSLIPKFFGKLELGKFLFNQGEREKLNDYLKKYPEGKELEMTVKAKYKKRTSGQLDEETNFNGYYWGVIVDMIGKELGYFTKEELETIHDWIQINVGNVKIMPNKDVVPAGTSLMSGGQFAEYTSKARMWASQPGNVCEMGMYIPEPNEADFDSSANVGDR